MVRSLRKVEAKDAPDTSSADDPKTTEAAPPSDTLVTEAEVAPEEAEDEKVPGEEVLVGHAEMDLVVLGQRADQEQRQSEEKKLPCLSRCCVKLKHGCSDCGGRLASWWSHRLDAWEKWLADREQEAVRQSYEVELRRLSADQLPPGGLMEPFFGPSIRTLEKCQSLTFKDKEVLLAFTEAQLKRTSFLKAKRQMLPKLLCQFTLGVLLAIALFCLLATLALAPTRSLNFKAGSLVDEGSAAAGAASVQRQALWDFPGLSLEQLRQIDDVLFEEKQRKHVLHIAGASKTPDGAVLLSSAESTLRIAATGAAYWSHGSGSEVLLEDMEILRNLGSSTLGALSSAVRYQ